MQASNLGYSGLGLSEVSPKDFSHDSVSRWLQSVHFRPRDIWQEAKDFVEKGAPCLLIGDDSILSKRRSKKIDSVHYQYSGNAHDVIPGIGLVNLLWHGLASRSSVPIDYRIYDKPTEG